MQPDPAQKPVMDVTAPHHPGVPVAPKSAEPATAAPAPALEHHAAPVHPAPEPKPAETSEPADDVKEAPPAESTPVAAEPTMHTAPDESAVGPEIAPSDHDDAAAEPARATTPPPMPNRSKKAGGEPHAPAMLITLTILFMLVLGGITVMIYLKSNS